MKIKATALLLATALVAPHALTACGNGRSAAGTGTTDGTANEPPGATSGAPVTGSGTSGHGTTSEEVKRTKVLLQVDSMVGTSPVQLAQQIHGAQVSLAEIYRPADVQLRIVTNAPSIPRQTTIRLADLHGLMTASTVTPEAGELAVHMLVVTKDADRPDTLGIMFDFGDADANDIPRQGFAVFEDAHNGLPTVPANNPQALAREVLLTTAHELTHVFNLHHTDWHGTGFESDSTVEGYSFTDTVKWSLSPASIAHFKGPSCPQALVLPGAGGLPFGLITEAHARTHQASPVETYDIVPDNMSAAARRGSSTIRSMATRSSRTINSARDVTAASPLRLALASAKTNYVVGEAVTLTAALTNTGASAADVVALLNPEYRFLTISVRAPNDQQFRTYLPPVLRDARGSASRSLAAKASLVEEVKVFFGSDGWTFETPGEYLIEATYPAAPRTSGEYIRSEQFKLTIAAAADTAPEARTARTYLSRNARLGRPEGLYLYMGGGSHLKDAEANLRKVVDQTPKAEQAVDARIALAREALSPSVEKQGSKPAARLDEARQLLQAAQGATDVASTTLLKAHGELIRKLDEAGREGAASAERATVDRELDRDNALRRLDRRDLERRL